LRSGTNRIAGFENGRAKEIQGRRPVTWLSTVGTGLNQCNRGVLMAPGAEENWTLSVQHSQEDVQRYVDNFAELAHDLSA
jgi:glutamate-1-semialdehyde aminotransferase